MNSYLLPVDEHELYVILDALVAFATACEADGDACKVAPTADAIADQVRAFHDLPRWETEWLKSAGLGRFRGRPQG